MSLLRFAFVLTCLLLSRCDCGAEVAGTKDSGVSADAGQLDGGGGADATSPECSLDSDCEDSDPCTADRCEQRRCAHPPALDGTPCGEEACGSSFACQAGVCTEGAPVDLDADDDGALTEACGGTDCDDSDPSVHPGADETEAAACADGKDNDCDGAADALDLGCGATELCQDGWCWENPRPHGLALTAVWPAGPDDVWFGGGIAGVAHFDGVGTVVDRPTVSGYPARIARMWGAAPDDVWAAANGMLHFDGSTWSLDPASAGLLPAGALDVWGLSADAVWAVGGNGRAIQYDGTAWTVHEVDPEGRALSSVHARASDDVWVAGYSGLVGHWDGSAWSVETIGTGNTALPQAIFAAAPDDVWVGGDHGFMWHHDGLGWSQVPGIPNLRLVGIYGSAPDDLWAVGDGGVVAHYNGSSWGQAATFPTAILAGIRGRGPDDIWAVGDAGMVLHYDGVAWQRVSAPAAPLDAFLTDVVALESPTGFEAWAVGNVAGGGGVVGQRDSEGVWQAADGVVAGVSSFATLCGAATDGVWAMGQGPAWHWDGVGWADVTLPGSGLGLTQVHDCCAVSATELWAVATDPIDDQVEILRGDGSGWSIDLQIEVGVGSDAPDLAKVFCLGPDEVWAGGEGILLHRGADATWRRFSNPSVGGGGLTRFFAPAPDDIWVLSGQGRYSYGGDLYHFDGVGWEQVELPGRPVDSRIHDVGGSSASDFWVVGGQGLAYHNDGSGFVRVAMPLSGGGTETPNFQFMLVVDVDDLILLDYDLATYRWDGAVLTSLGSNTVSGDIGDVFFAAADRAWATSDTFGSTVFSWDGLTWTPDYNFPIWPRAVWGFATDDVWAVGESLDVAHYDGASWTATHLASGYTSEDLVDVWGAAPNEIWAVGNEGSLWRNSGAGFVLVSSEAGVRRAAVYGSSAGEVWLFGSLDGNEVGPLVERGGAAGFERHRVLEHPAHIQRVGTELMAFDAFSGVWTRGASGWQLLVEPTPYDGHNSTEISSAFFIGADSGYVHGGERLRRFANGSYSGVDIDFTFPTLSLGGYASGSETHLWAVGRGGAVLHRVE